MITPAIARNWLVDHAFPLWLEHGVDWILGAFEEDLDPTSLHSKAPFRRLRVVARQIYVFAQAAKLGVPRAQAAVDLGIAFLRNHARLPDGSYAMRLDRAGQVIDRTLDFYDHAFVLLAYAHAGERAAALDVLAVIDQRLAHPLGGWHESAPPALPRRQNPHMHFLEATLSAFACFGDPVFLDRADAVVDLFLDRFFQADAPGLPEYYDDALNTQREQGCFVLEPGHHHEWVWLLDEHQRLATLAGRTPRPTRAAATALMTFAEAHGVLPNGIVVGELWSDGRVKSRATRVWPHTERIKALSRLGTEAQVSSALTTLWTFFEGVPQGLWRERWHDGYVAGDAAPASTLYHITCALLEIQPKAG